jgi:single-stranded-DNA-specific exonuclease
MTYENCCYIKRGLDIVNNGSNPFFSAMREKDNAELAYTPEDISFSIAPKVNAASRMGDTRLGAAGLFLDSKDDQKMSVIINQLCELNEKRRELTSEAKEAVAQIKDEGKKIIAFNGKGYQKGIHGIIAGEISKMFPDYPAFVYCHVEGECRGSVRCNNDGIDTMDMFKQLKDMGYVESCAGHSNACVLSVKEEKLDAFVDAFTDMYNSMDIPPVVVKYDAAASLKSLSTDVLKKLSEIPFTAQEQPLFLVKNVMINEVSPSKSNPKNIKFTFADNTAVRKVWAWGMADEYARKGSPKEVDLVCSLTQDFMKKSYPWATLRIVDMIPVA